MASSDDTISVADAFAILKLPVTASAVEIRKSYRALSLKFHPDKVSKDVSPKQASHLFHLLHKAYEILSESSTRERLTKKAEEEAQRRERVGKFEAERKKMSDELDRREKEQEARRREESQAARKRELDLERLKEEGRRLREENGRSRAAALRQATKDYEDTRRRNGTAMAAGFAAASSGANLEEKEPQLGPLDTSVRLLYPLSLHAALSPSLERILTQRYGPLLHFKQTTPVSDPAQRAGAEDKKRKRSTEVVCLVTFVDLDSAVSLVESGSEFRLADATRSIAPASTEMDQVWVEWAAAKQAQKKLKEAKKSGLSLSDDESSDTGSDAAGKPRLGEPRRVRWWRQRNPSRFRDAVDGRGIAARGTGSTNCSSQLANPSNSVRVPAATEAKRPVNFEADVLRRAMDTAAKAKRATPAPQASKGAS